ncbi:MULTISPECIES: hypothetical protein [unclassified Stenotrophomonas]|uniref:hypothetical protein n=1 Tax=unclassified Stenotrophomonas TaxID=196198 RepID=UPI003012FA13
METRNPVRTDLFHLTVPLLTIFKQVVVNKKFDALDWEKLEQIVSGAVKEGCARLADVDEVSGTAKGGRDFNADRLGNIYKCLDGKIYGTRGRVPPQVGKIKSRKM